MAGFAFDTQRGTHPRARRWAAAASSALLLAALGALAPSADAVKAKKGAKKAACATPATLYPNAIGADRYTMVFRINTPEDVDTYANPDETAGGLRPRVLDRDIFLINTRFKNSDAATEQEIATKLGQAFPCNRIFALNGLSFNPASEGYMFSLLQAPQVSAILLDWEKLDWDVARASDPGTPAWVDPFNPMLKRLKGRVAALANTIIADPAAGAKRIGIVPFARADWNLGLMARVVDRQSGRIVSGRRGFQSSQTQKACQTGGGAGLAANIKTVFRQYKKANFKKIKRKGKGRNRKPRFKKLKPKTNKFNLGVQISFTATPDPTASDPVRSVDPSKAADCTARAVNQKAGAILYWARPSDVDALLAQPAVCALRPSPSGVC
jgi:hypothetical protein